MGDFDAIAKAKRTNNFVYLEPDNNFVLMLNQIFVKENSEGVKNLIVEAKVVETSTPGAIPGQNRSRVIKLKDKFGSGPAEIRNLIETCFLASEGTPAEDKDLSDDAMQVYIGKDQPFAGLIIACRTKGKPTKAGGVFTTAAWEALPPSQVTKYKALAASLGLTK